LLLNKIRPDIPIVRHCAVHNPPDQATACSGRGAVLRKSSEGFRGRRSPEGFFYGIPGKDLS